MINIDSANHVRGRSIYVNDIPVMEGTLYGVVFGSPVAHGRLRSVDLSEALACPGVAAILTAKDIPGENQIGSILPDEELFADREVDFMGMPIALVLASSEDLANRARKRIKVDIEERPPLVTARAAHAAGSFICPPRTFEIGAVDAAWAECAHIVEGQAEMGGQEHVYLETQGTYAYPTENGGVKLHSSTQATKYVQRGVARVLGIPMHRIEVDTNRIGGGFGGKEDQATPWACLAALGAHLLDRPVKLVLSRADDMRMTGKRHPYSFDFKLGLDRDLKIRAYQMTAYQDAGASADVSMAVLERTLFHGTSSYFVPNARITCHSCRTHLPPNTAFRGFGAPQAMFAMEAAIMKAAVQLGVDPAAIQKPNLLREGDEFPYGQKAQGCRALQCWETAERDFELARMRREVADFNRTNRLFKKGLALYPLCFGLSFTKTSLNQGRALVHVYTDGSVSVTTGVIEMGQGVNTKIVQAAAATFGIPPGMITVHSTNTTRIANASPTAASTGADLNGKATIMACSAILARMKGVAAQELRAQDPGDIELRDGMVLLRGESTGLDWNRLVYLMDENRAALSEHAHYATPVIHFNKATEKGHPFAYHVYGTAVTVATVDCLRGTYEIDQVKIVHDLGLSMNLDLDIGQIEGALVQGIGLMTIEELLYGPTGKNLYATLSSYKVPDIYFTPKVLEIHPLASEPDPLALLGSKAVGEPPLVYGIGAYFAILQAMRAFNPGLKVELNAPMTPQKCLLSLYPE
ncbi:MAG: molybdopterin-dependent oxidoreductase [Holophaga sp.]|nr:molybdopterin-dependent oxidoreductase [Holophaga sp.]